MIVQQSFYEELAKQGKRSDSRGLDAYRDVHVETGVIAKAEGSARARIGITEVIVGVKAEVKEPFPDKPDEGMLIVGAELSPLSYSKFEPGPPREEAIELARVIDRGIRESKSIDTKKLCLEPGKRAWVVYVDIHIINHAGNLIDTAALAATAALWTSKMPEYDGEKVNYEKKTNIKLPVLFKPVAVTVARVADRLLVDPSLEEEVSADARLVISTKDNGNICAMQKMDEAGFSAEEIRQMLDIAVEKGKELRKAVEKALK